MARGSDQDHVMISWAGVRSRLDRLDSAHRAKVTEAGRVAADRVYDSCQFADPMFGYRSVGDDDGVRIYFTAWRSVFEVHHFEFNPDPLPPYEGFWVNGETGQLVAIPDGLDGLTAWGSNRSVQTFWASPVRDKLTVTIDCKAVWDEIEALSDFACAEALNAINFVCGRAFSAGEAGQASGTACVGRVTLIFEIRGDYFFVLRLSLNDEPRDDFRDGCLPPGLVP
jgi:hypothetical protein